MLPAQPVASAVGLTAAPPAVLALALALPECIRLAKPLDASRVQEVDSVTHGACLVAPIVCEWRPAGCRCPISPYHPLAVLRRLPSCPSALQVFTSQHWMMRIYRVRDMPLRDPTTKASKKGGRMTTRRVGL